MAYKKIDVELIVVADDAEAVVAELNGALDQMEERYAIFGGGIETVVVEHRRMRRRSALMHTRAAGQTATLALRAASDRVASIFREII
jgi:hypothetical protein